MPAGLPSTSTGLDRGSRAPTGIRRPIRRGALLSFERPGRGSPRKTSHRTLKTAQLANASGFHRSVRCLSRQVVRTTGSPRITSTSREGCHAQARLKPGTGLPGRTLLSFERPRRNAWFFYVGVAPVHLENSIVALHVFFSIKRTRAYGGCLGAESR